MRDSNHIRKVLPEEGGEGDRSEVRTPSVYGDAVSAARSERAPSLPISLEEVPPAAAPDLVSEVWAFESLWRQSVAGVIAVLFSQPADVLLTLTNQEGETLGTALPKLTAEPQLALNGLVPRMLFGVLLTSLQFLFYSQLRGFFGVSKADLTFVWDTLAVIKGV